MKKTLFLVFVHGFRGGNDTFGRFPEHLVALIRHALPNIDVLSLTYPKFETRGELKECVGRFRDWLQDKVIDLEVANQTPSPTIDPAVHVIIVGHSMGGIVGAETLLLLASEQPLPPPSSLNKTANSAAPAEPAPFFMFPHIQGLIAFDTPFLGIAPGVVSHGAEGHYKSASTAYSTFSEVAGLFGMGGNKSESVPTSAASNRKFSAPLPLPAAATDAISDDAAATPSWQRWGRYAMFAGAAGAVAAGGAAALYSQRDRFTAGWGWMSSHLAFIGCLARPGDLRQRVASLTDLYKERGIASVNFYTVLGKAAAVPSGENTSRSTSSLILRIPRAMNRTFCHLPQDFNNDDIMITTESGLRWVAALNDRAVDETTAHITMFTPKDNPSYYKLAHDAADTVVKWMDEGWYASATPQVKSDKPNSSSNRQERGFETGNRFMEADDVVVVD